MFVWIIDFNFFEGYADRITGSSCVLRVRPDDDEKVHIQRRTVCVTIELTLILKFLT